MECNRDEAIKAKELAEKKLSNKDLVGAKKFTLKAQTLFPDLDGLPQLLATLDVYISAEKKMNGELDWYGVLGVDPSSDEDTLRKQYRKLALILHPDKNKSFGADGAFKILSEAWSLMSDKSKRAAYDQRRNNRGSDPKISNMNASASFNGNGFHPSSNSGNSSMRSQKNTKQHSNLNAHLPFQSRTDTFWTACTRCRMQYEYLKVYLNQRLLCPNCQEPFYAKQMPPPQMGGNTSWAPYARQQTSNHSRPDSNTFMSGPMQGGQSASLEDAMKSKLNAYKRTACDTNGSTFAPKNERPQKRGRQGELKLNDNGKVFPQMDKAVPGSKFSNSIREPSLSETRNVLMNKATRSISRYLNEGKNLASVSGKSHKPVAGKGKEVKKSNMDYPLSAALDGIHGTPADSATNSASKQAASGNSFPMDQSEDSSHETSALELDNKSFESAALTMTVPDPDFHDFDNDRTEDSFADNQVWAAYDDDDGMPRYYAMVHSVVSRKPFKMRISWLNSKSNAEFGSMNWIGSGFYKTCGDFRIGKYEFNKLINSFSHKVNWAKGARGAVQIYPKKGDVWALYRNWSTDWDEQTPDEVIHKYSMVEVVEDYDEEKGLLVVPLVKVAGYKTVFHQSADPEQVTRIPKEEMFKLSHQVPSCFLTGQESPNAPKGCWELDPAATPLELLGVITEAEEQAVMGSSEEARRDRSV
ncbi:hypothetical protein V2J09_006146 [Rumex salicifolius]